jgi:hypothetical protein
MSDISHGTTPMRWGSGSTARAATALFGGIKTAMVGGLQIAQRIVAFVRDDVLVVQTPAAHRRVPEAF